LICVVFPNSNSGGNLEDNTTMGNT